MSGKRYVVRWSMQASEELRRAVEYVSKHDIAYASQLGQGILENVNSLHQFPLRGRSGRIAGTRELVLQKHSYLIIYEVQGDCVHILHVRHTAQQRLDTTR